MKRRDGFEGWNHAYARGWERVFGDPAPEPPVISPLYLRTGEYIDCTRTGARFRADSEGKLRHVD